MDFDVVVIGGGLAGMVSASAIGRAGRKVLLVERQAGLGGRLRSFEMEGGFVVDAGAYLWPDGHVSEAARRAGARDFAASQVPLDRVLRLFVEGERGRRFSFPYPLREPTPKLLAAAEAALGLDASGYDDLRGLWRRLAELPDERVDELRRVPLAEGLAALGVAGPVAAAFLRNVMLYGAYDPGRASTAECIELCRRPRGRAAAVPVVAGANPEGGVRALVRSLERALADAGVAVELATEVTRIDVEGDRVRGVRAARSSGRSWGIAAPVVVANAPIWQAIELLDEGALPDDFVRIARSWSVVGGVIAAAYAFRGMPRLRESGEEDDFPGWTRLLTGDDRSFGGGMVWATLHSPHNAPPGCHVLQAMRLSPHTDVDDPRREAEVHSAFDRMIEEIYADAADKLLWSRRWSSRDGSEYMLSAEPRPPVRAPGVDGLYFVGETTDVPAVQMDAAALSAIRCADLILERPLAPGE